jgi:hypothetical protein
MPSTPLQISRIGLFAILAPGLVGAGCAIEPPARRLHGGYRLMQKQQYQALYGPDGRILRLLVDRDRDGRAEAVVVYRRNGRPERGEIDTDGDGAVDRWEQLRTDGSLERVDLDTDRDGRVDRTDYPQ